MEQTFNDLYTERKRQTKQVLLGFILWTFIETSMGIIQEHILLIKEMNSVKNMLTNLRSPAIISFLLTIPLMIMEIVNRRNFNEGFPIPLFGILWLMPLIFIVILMPIVRSVEAGNGIMVKPISLFTRVIFLAFIAWMWISIVKDQMPCFCGLPNCD
ncbi:MAG: hypothetical protein H7Y59_10870 [Anaerolineales bacterium]|nr:hypothetical protein [Anaerolineales bacterium]